MTTDPLTLPPAAIGEAKSYLRVSGTDEDELAARLVRAAVELCEQFTGQMLLTRGVVERMNARQGGGWRRLSRAPVRAITSVQSVGDDGAATALPAEAYAIDIVANGEGWIRPPQSGLVQVEYTAGLAASWELVPEPLRHGAIRLAAHLYAHRDTAQAEGPPAAVTALWRPWRRVRIGGACSRV